MSSSQNKSRFVSYGIYSLRNITTVILLSLILIFLAPWKYDDGWELMTLESSLTSNVYSYVIAFDDIEYTFRKIWYWLMSMFYGLNDSVYFMRLPSVACVVLSFYLIVSSASSFSALKKHAYVFVLIFWIWSSYLFLVTLRPEPIIALLTALLIRLLIVISQRRTSLVLVLIMPIGFFAASIHPVGFCLAISAFSAALITLSFQPVFNKQLLVAVVVFALLGIYAGYRIALWNLSFPEWYRLLSIVAEGDHHNKTLGHEMDRYRDLWNLDPAFFLIFLFSLVTSWIVFIRTVCYKVRNVDIPLNKSQFSHLLIAPIGLLTIFYFLIFPSKWSHYFGIITPVATFYIALFFNSDIYGRFKHRTYFAYAIFGLSTILIFDAGLRILGFSQHSYLKSYFGLTSQKRNLFGSDFIFDHRPTAIILPYLFPYFDEFKVLPLDRFSIIPNYIFMEPNAINFYKEKFNSDLQFDLVSKFYFEGKAIHVYKITQ